MPARRADGLALAPTGAMQPTAADLLADLLPAHQGVGPLYQRDYWAVIADCRVRPSRIADDLARRFWHYPPPELVNFTRAGGDGGPLRVGDELDVHIRVAGACRVRVVAREPQSLTLATLGGHPEAGRITFGAYRNDQGDVVFHIRSRARSSSQARYLGFLAAGEPMQTNTWTDFVVAVARTFGGGVKGQVHARTQQIADEPEGATCTPTYLARGD
jgi:hypothetical protein